MLLSELRREWAAAGQYCAENGCGTRCRIASARCWEHHGRKRLAITADGKGAMMPDLEWCSIIADGKLTLL